jgi:hypothetical protein
MGDPSLEPGHVFITRRQDLGRDQDAAQVLDCLAGGQFVEGLVGDPLADETPQDLWGCAPAEPGRHRRGPLDCRESVIERSQFGLDVAVVGA